MPSRSWRTGRYILCRKCGQYGGTLHSVGDEYEHSVCPAPKPREPVGPWRLRSQSKLVVPGQELVTAHTKIKKV